MTPKLKWPLNQIVEVEWEDANSYGKWHNLQELAKHHSTAPCKTIGWLLKKDKRQILVVQTQTAENDGDGTGTMAIPIGFIKRIRRIK